MRGGEATQRDNQPMTAQRETTTLFSGGGGGGVGGSVAVDDANVGHNRLRTWHEEDVVAVAAGNNTTIK